MISKFIPFALIIINVVIIGFNVFFLYDNGLLLEQEFSVSDDLVVHFSNDYYVMLTEQWVNDKDEFIYCLYGNVTDGEVFVERLSSVAYSANSTHVVHKSCKHSNDYLGNVHSHPNGACKFSGTDLFNFGVDDSLIKCLVCGVDKLGCVSSEDVDKLVEVVII